MAFALRGGGLALVDELVGPCNQELLAEIHERRFPSLRSDSLLGPLDTPKAATPTVCLEDLVTGRQILAQMTMI